jgi:hypothetical protein
MGQFNFECCPLVQEIISVIRYLPFFGKWLVTCPYSQPSLPFLCLFPESSAAALKV